MEFSKRKIKLFILSGKARSGKDTVAKIINQYYDNSITISFGHYIKDYAKRIVNWDGAEATKPREFLQNLGIELIRDKIDDKLFINRILEDIEVFSYFYDIIIIDDARLVAEVETLKKHYSDSISIRVIRDNFDNGLSVSEKKHITEQDLDNYTKFDYLINNNGDYDKLKNNVEKILKEV